MGLTGLAIFKLLPKTNCGECGVPTCLAFAMALAAGKATLSQCPYVSNEAREALDAATAPPIKLVKMGSGDKVLDLGDEQVIFRHDKTFYHQTGIFIEVADNDASLAAKVDEINGIVIERVGQMYEVDGVAIANASGSADTFKAAAEAVAGKTDKAIILMTERPTCMEAAAGAIAARKPLLYAATADNYEKMVEIAKKVAAPLAVKGADLNGMADLVAKIDYKELVIDSGARQISRVIADQTQIRNVAVKKRFRPYGYPTITFTTEADPAMEVLEAQVFISKYASIVVLKTTKIEYLLSLFTWRNNLYTDPQKPIAVQPGVYAIGAANEKSPVYITTNFSLTYYTVQTEVESTRIPSYLIAFDTDGLSVMTAWAGGKFIGEMIGPWLKDSDINQKVNKKVIIIPGGVAAIKGKIEDLSGWEVMVGPRDAAGIGSFAKLRLSV
ncbi:MAG: acetyl-CoA decarbonylase/synthase complex subunit gamma [Thermacetogeniaceae bacterium]|jgi:acetyl-CoA decarbonylase/synthase complex subunit gamma